MNLRQATRYTLSCPAQYQWLSSDGLEQNGAGVTRDLGVSGAFIRGDRSPAVGTQIDLSIALPNCEDTRYGMRLRGMGKVLRVEQDSDAQPGGFAVLVNLDASPP
jgi:hypothetical protein